jgi:hypothetical protein
MLTVIEDAGPRLGEVAMILAALAAAVLALKDFVVKPRVSSNRDGGSSRVHSSAAKPVPHL